MRPLKLILQAFGPYKDREEIDFEKLSENGIFLIKGPTGSGKTTIFDGMTFALYGGSSGEDSKSKIGRNDLQEWRCNQADSKTSTIVEFTFSIYGKVYRFTRKLELKRTNYAEINDISLRGDDGIFYPQEENPKSSVLNTRAVELIGLTKDQFRQVVLLPQGQFEKFLTAPSEDKEIILSKIFNSEQWKKYASEFYKAANNRVEYLAGLKKYIDTLLSEEGLSNIDELNSNIKERKKELKDLEIKYQSFDSKTKLDKLNKSFSLLEQFKGLHSLEKKADELKAMENEIDAKREEVDEADKLEELRELINDVKAKDKDARNREKEYNNLAMKKEAYEASEAEAKSKLESRKNSAKESELTKEKVRLEGKIDIYTRLNELYSAYVKAKETFEKSRRDRDNCQSEFDLGKKNAAERYSEYNEASEKAKFMRNKYYKGIYGEIAKDLLDGDKCPVCGSTHHPELAVLSSDSVSKEQMEAAEGEAEKIKGLWEKADANREKLQKLLDDAEGSLHKASVEKEKTETEYNGAKNNLEPDIENLNALNKCIKNIEAAIQSEKDDIQRLEEEYKNKHDDLNNYRSKLQSALKEQDEAKDRYTESDKILKAEMVKRGYNLLSDVKLLETEERTKLHRDIAAYETNVKNNKEQLMTIKNDLAGIQEPDEMEIKAAQEKISNVDREYNSRSSLLKEQIKRLEDKSSKLKEKAEEYTNNINQAESDFTFAKKLRGDTGIGLQRYVLGIMFDQVIFEANNMLRKVHNGRYQLFRTDDKGSGNKRGLELIAHDSRKPEEKGRAVSMLSGGEKFLVSLSLSIGMSNVAQKSGLRIEALFIDEGFGTLDDSSINDAMDILKSIQQSNGMIGIISHVQILESNIPTHLEVVKTDGGSKIKKS